MTRHNAQSRPPGYGSHRPESFQRYYLRNVAIGEGCGCVEQVILRHGSSSAGRPASANVLLAAFASLWRWVRRLR